MSNSSSDWSEDGEVVVDVVGRFMNKAASDRFDVPYSMLSRPMSTQRCLELAETLPRISKVKAALESKLGEGSALFCEQVASLIERQHLPREERLDRVRNLLFLCEVPLVRGMLKADAIPPAAFVTMTELSFAAHHEWYQRHVQEFDRQRDLLLADAPVITHQYACPSCGCEDCTITAMPTGDKVKWGGDSDGQTTVTCTRCNTAFKVN